MEPVADLEDLAERRRARLTAVSLGQLEELANDEQTSVFGLTEPRIFTPALRDLDDPDASWGHDFITFCDRLDMPLDPWQRWLAIHLGEFLLDGSPRYRKAIVLVARQNGKTLFARLLILFWMFVDRVPEIMATSTDRGAAKRFWLKTMRLAEQTPMLRRDLAGRHAYLQIGEEDFWNTHGSHYRFAAPTRRAGRGDTLDRALLDEFREHLTRDTWGAVLPAMSTVADALVLCISNEGDADSVVLHEEYDAAEKYVLTGEGDPSAFLAAWSTPSGAAPDDVDALRQANPGLGYHGPRLDALLAEGMSAMAAGGDTLQRHLIEVLCQRVDLLNAAIRLEDWNSCGILRADALDLAPHRRSVALCFDVAQDSSHATLTAAATLDGITHLEVVAAWDGMDCRKRIRRDLPGIVERIRPRKLVWFPGGPAAAVADEWPAKRLRNVIIEAIRAEDVVRACMGLEEQAAAGHLRHPHDPLLDLQVRQTQQLPQGDGWRFARRGKAPIDAVYSAAGAAHVARTLPRMGPVA